MKKGEKQFGGFSGFGRILQKLLGNCGLTFVTTRTVVAFNQRSSVVPAESEKSAELLFTLLHRCWLGEQHIPYPLSF
jgi:hypothetical protein